MTTSCNVDDQSAAAGCELLREGNLPRGRGEKKEQYGVQTHVEPQHCTGASEQLAEILEAVGGAYYAARGDKEWLGWRERFVTQITALFQPLPSEAEGE